MVGEYRGNRETHSDPYSFDDECKATNAFFGRNSGFNEIKAHHYIVSFAPEDVRDNGLTPEKRLPVNNLPSQFIMKATT